jgi:hypothetical protein
VCALELACWCCCRVPARRTRVLLQGVALKMVCVLELACWCRCRVVCAVCRCKAPLQGVAAGCRCRMPLQGYAVRVLRELWGWLAGAAAGRGCRVLLSKGLSASQELGCCYKVRALGTGLLLSLQGAAVRCLWQCGRWALLEITFMP